MCCNKKEAIILEAKEFRVNTSAEPHPASKFELVRGELEIQASAPPGGDLIYGAWAQSMLDEPPTTPLGEAMRALAETRLHNDISPSECGRTVSSDVISETVGTLRASMITFLITTINNFSYESLEKPENWIPLKQKINAALAKPAPETPQEEQLALNLQSRRVQTSLSDRYTSIEVAVQALRERFPEGIRWLDIGSGIMQGPNRLFRKDEFPLHIQAMLNASGHENEELTAKVRALLKRPSLFKECVCVDTQNVYLPSRDMFDPRVLEWARGSLRPGEFSSPEFMRTFEGLAASKHPGISFEWLNVLRPADADTFEKRHPGKQFDLISLVTTAHQMPRVVFQAIMQWADSKLSDNGLLWMKDFGHLAGRHNSLQHPYGNVRMFTHWHLPFRYRDFFADNQQLLPGFQEAFRYKDNSRCMKMTTSTGRLALNGELYPIADLIRHA